MTYKFDDAQLAHLKACRAQGLNLKQSAAEIGIHPDTMRLAIMRDGYDEQVRAMYPRFGFDGSGPKPRPQGEIRKLTPDDVEGLPLNIEWTPQVRWLTQPWRSQA